MPLSKQLFRESALERLSSPEQLDQLLQITSPKGWISLIAIWALLIVVIAWSFFGTVLTKIEGHGILVAGAGLELVVADGAGRLDSIKVEVGDEVKKGNLLAEIDKRDLQEQRNELNSRVVGLEEQKSELDAFDEMEAKLRRDLATEERIRQEKTITLAKKSIDRLTERMYNVAELVVSGTLASIELHSVAEEIEAAETVWQQAQFRIDEIEADLRKANLTREREGLKREHEIGALRLQIDSLESRIQRESKVICPVDGQVVEIRVAVRNAVTVGEPILIIKPTGESEMEAIIYVSAVTGKRIKPGMAIELQPSTVKREEFGSLMGKVVRIDEKPTSKLAMLARLSGDKDLVEQFTRAVGLPLETKISLIIDASTPSGLKWSTKQGPPRPVSAGTLCTASVTVESQSPMSLVFPGLKRQPDVE